MSKHKSKPKVPFKKHVYMKKVHINQEQLMLDPTIQWVVGLDEVGTGSVAGPIGVGCVMLPVEIILNVKDSKAYSSEKKRQQAAALVYEQALFAEAIMGSAAWIDESGLSKVKDHLMFQLLEKVDNVSYNPSNTVIVFDGAYIPKKLPSFLKPYRLMAVPKADAKINAVSAASVIAKVLRDDYMNEVAEQEEYAKYDILKNKGYLSPNHIRALKAFGPSPLHRLSISAVREHVRE